MRATADALLGHSEKPFVPDRRESTWAQHVVMGYGVTHSAGGLCKFPCVHRRPVLMGAQECMRHLGRIK